MCGQAWAGRDRTRQGTGALQERGDQEHGDTRVEDKEAGGSGAIYGNPALSCTEPGEAGRQTFYPGLRHKVCQLLLCPAEHNLYLCVKPQGAAQHFTPRPIT